MQVVHSLVSLFSIIVCLEYSSALRCYDCNSATDKRCLADENNKLSDDLKITCLERTPDGKPFILCRKIKQVIDFEVNGLLPESRIIRTCGWDDSNYKNRCYQRSGFGGRQEVCACEGDGCNSSSSVYASLSLVLALILLIITM